MTLSIDQPREPKDFYVALRGWCGKTNATVKISRRSARSRQGAIEPHVKGRAGVAEMVGATEPAMIGMQHGH
jgi:hypothetical protein